MKLNLVIGFVLLLSFSSISIGQTKKLFPVDESAKDPTFFVFRARLFRAIQERDAKFIYSILDEKIQNDFGGGVGARWHDE